MDKNTAKKHEEIKKIYEKYGILTNDTEAQNEDEIQEIEKFQSLIDSEFNKSIELAMISNEAEAKDSTIKVLESTNTENNEELSQILTYISNSQIQINKDFEEIESLDQEIDQMLESLES